MARQPAKAAATAAPRSAPEAAPDPMANVPRDGRAVVIGRDGKAVYRQNGIGSASDPYAIANELAPPGWVYEWKRYSTLNQVDFSYQATVQRVGGWTPVMADRHPGVWLPADTKGAIIIDGLILMERPIELHIEATREFKRQADGAMRKAKEERALIARSQGVDVNTPAARGASFVKEGRLLDGSVGRDGMSDADAIAQARPAYSYDQNSID